MRYLLLGAVLVVVSILLMGMTPFRLEEEVAGLLLLACAGVVMCEGWVADRSLRQERSLASECSGLREQLKKAELDASILKNEWGMTIRRAENAEQRVQEMGNTIRAREEAFAAERGEFTTRITALEKAALDAQAVKATVESDGASGTLVAFLGQLQEHGRFLDFVSEEVSTFSDAQVAGAARFVHAGCRKVVRQYVDLVPVKDQPAGSTVTIGSDDGDAAAVRIVGRGNTAYPVTGKLIHAGWRATRVTAPVAAPPSARMNAAARLISPAEVEVVA